MSAFLGPIHYWLYNKIQLQQSIVDELYTLGSNLGLPLQVECEARYGGFENKPLEEMIDHGNIHGWLQERVSQVEYKYAYSILALVNRDPAIMDQLKELLRNKGAKLGRSLQTEQLNAPQLYKVISDSLLDGMPCDHANRIVSQEEHQVIWTRSVCVHRDYWEEVGGDVRLYYELREAWIGGLAEECGFTFLRLEDRTYSINSV